MTINETELDARNVPLVTEVIKRIYKSWRFSASKITVAEATALALFDLGLLSGKETEIDLSDITVDRLVKKYKPRAYRASDEE